MFVMDRGSRCLFFAGSSSAQPVLVEERPYPVEGQGVVAGETVKTLIIQACGTEADDNQIRGHW